MLHELDEQSAHEERLVPVVADVFDLEDHVVARAGCEVERVAALDEPSGRTKAQAGQADPDEAADVVGDLLAVSDLVDDPFRGLLQITKRRPARRGTRYARLAERQVPAEFLVAAGQRAAEYLRERLVGVE